MLEIISELNPLVSLASFIIGIFGIGLAIYFYKIGVRTRMPCFSMRSFNVISDEIKKYGDLKVLYRDDEIMNLTITRIAIWNGGKETINFNDLAPKDLIKIIPINNNTIFDSEILSHSNDTCQFSINWTNSEINISFDYMDYNQGCHLKITHSGKKSSDLLVSGTVKGYGKIKEIEDQKEESSDLSSIGLAYSLGILALIFYIGLEIKEHISSNYLWLTISIVMLFTGIRKSYKKRRASKIFSLDYEIKKD